MTSVSVAGVQTYRERLELAAGRYKQIQREDPHEAWGPVKHGHANIPNTAEVLAILRCAGEAYESRSVQRGLGYLATRVFTHPRPATELGGRWPVTRLLVYGLLGLTQWDQWVHDNVLRESRRLDHRVTVREAVEHCVEWLQAHRAGDGWPDRSDEPQCSVLQTSTAILALSRVARLPDELQAARDLLAHVQNRRTGSWPEVVGGRAYRGEGSPAHTALAVMALCGGDSGHRQHAERGSDWLLKEGPRWQRATHPERHEGVEPWLHMTFALGLRACLQTGIGPLSPELRPSIDLLDELWVDRNCEWQGGEGERTSVHGSHAVVLAYEELRRAQARVDPITFFELVRAGTSAESEVQEHYRLRLRKSVITIVDTRSGVESPPLSLGDRSQALVRKVAELQFRAEPVDGLVPLNRLAGISKDAKTMIRRINAQVSEATEGRVPRLLHVPRGSTDCALTLKVFE